MAASKANWMIHLEQVDNGYVLEVNNFNNYEKTRSVYASIDAALEALRGVTAHIESKFLIAAPKAEVAVVSEPDDVPF